MNKRNFKWSEDLSLCLFIKSLESCEEFVINSDGNVVVNLNIGQ